MWYYLVLHYCFTVKYLCKRHNMSTSNLNTKVSTENNDTTTIDWKSTIKYCILELVPLVQYALWTVCFQIKPKQTSRLHFRFVDQNVGSRFYTNRILSEEAAPVTLLGAFNCYSCALDTELTTSVSWLNLFTILKKIFGINREREMLWIEIIGVNCSEKGQISEFTTSCRV